MGEGSEQDRIAFTHIRLGYRLEPAPGPGHGPDSVHIEPVREVLVESGDRGLADIIDTVGLAAVVADRVAVTVRDDRLHCIGRELPPGLDRVDIDEELVDLAGFDPHPASHLSISCFREATWRSRFSRRRCISAFWSGLNSWRGAVSRRRTRRSVRVYVA